MSMAIDGPGSGNEGPPDLPDVNGDLPAVQGNTNPADAQGVYEAPAIGVDSGGPAEGNLNPAGGNLNPAGAMVDFFAPGDANDPSHISGLKFAPEGGAAADSILNPSAGTTGLSAPRDASAPSLEIAPGQGADPSHVSGLKFAPEAAMVDEGPPQNRGKLIAGLGFAAIGVAFLIALLLGAFNGDSHVSANRAAASNKQSPDAPPPTAISGSIVPDGAAAAAVTTIPGGTATTVPGARGGAAATNVPAGRTATTAPAGGATATTAPPATTTPPPAPTVSGFSANPGEIWESYATPKPTSCTSTTTSKISVTATDPSGIDTVTVDWSVNGAYGSIAMSRVGTSDTVEGVLGSFKAGTVGPSGDTVALTAKAVDKGGRTSTNSSKVFLHSYQGCLP